MNSEAITDFRSDPEPELYFAAHRQVRIVVTGCPAISISFNYIGSRDAA